MFFWNHILTNNNKFSVLQLWVRGDLLVLLERSLLQHRVSTEPLAQVKIQSNGFALKYLFWNIESQSAFCFFYSYCYWMAYIMYIICALQGTQEKLPEETLRAAKESEGGTAAHTHMWSEYLAVTQTTTTTKPLQIIILRLLSELVKWSFVDAAKYLVAQFSPRTERKRTFHQSSNPVEANISQTSDWHLVDMFSVPIG